MFFKAQEGSTQGGGATLSWRLETVLMGGGALAVFFGCWEECRKTENFQSSQAQDLAISPFSPHHSPVGPIFLGVIMATWPLPPSRMRSGRPAGAVPRCPQKCRPGPW